MKSELLSNLCYIAAYGLALYWVQSWLDEFVARRRQRNEDDEGS